MSKRKPRGRPLNGLLLLDKPQGISSNKALQIAKRLFDAQKAGHTGSLDPLATGMLPICFGEATKVSSYLLDSDKSYFVTGLLGVTTDSGDADGNVVAEHDALHVTEASIKAILPDFMGEIAQVPPMYSALKRDGQPLYKLARQGIEVERKARHVTIHDIQFESYENQLLSLVVTCSKGTYIRTLIEDIGERLGCGAHVTVLHRLHVDPFEPKTMVSLQTLEALAEQENAINALDSYLLDTDAALPQLPKIQLLEVMDQDIHFGRQVNISALNTTWTEGLCRMYGVGGCFLGVGAIDANGVLSPKKLMSGRRSD